MWIKPMEGNTIKSNDKKNGLLFSLIFKMLWIIIKDVRVIMYLLKPSAQWRRVIYSLYLLFNNAANHSL